MTGKKSYFVTFLSFPIVYYKSKVGAAGYRTPYLSHAKRALYHLSYSPDYHTSENINYIYDLKLLVNYFDIDSDREENSLISKVKLLLSFLSKRILKNSASKSGGKTTKNIFPDGESNPGRRGESAES